MALFRSSSACPTYPACSSAGSCPPICCSRKRAQPPTSRSRVPPPPRGTCGSARAAASWERSEDDAFRSPCPPPHSARAPDRPSTKQHGRARAPRSRCPPSPAYLDQRPGDRDLALSAPARGEPCRLAALGIDGADARPRGGQAAPGFDRLLLVPLVSCDGAGVLRGSADRLAHERELRMREGRSRGATRRRRAVHGGGPGDDRAGRLAAERVPHPRATALLRRYLLSARAPSRDPSLEAG